MTRDFRRAWTANFSVGMALRSRATRPRKTWPVTVRYRPQSPGQRGSGIREIGPAKLPVVFGDHAVHLGDLFMDIKAFCNHRLCCTRCRQPLGFSGSPPFSISDSVRVGGLSKNARLLHRSSSLGTLRHRAGLIERRLRFCVQIKFWPLVFSHGEKTTSRGVTLSVRSSTLRIWEVATIMRFELVPGAEPRGMKLRE